MNTSAFITSLLTSFVVFLVLLGVFLILSRRPGNFYVYFPHRAIAGEGPPTRKRGMFTWIVEACRATDEELVATAGLDATAYVYLFTTGMLIPKPCLFEEYLEAKYHRLCHTYLMRICCVIGILLRNIWLLLKLVVSFQREEYDRKGRTYDVSIFVWQSFIRMKLMKTRKL